MLSLLGVRQKQSGRWVSEFPGRRLCIVGAGGHGRETLGIVRDINRVCHSWEFLGFADDDCKDEVLLDRLNTKLIGKPDDVPFLDCEFVVAVGNPVFRRSLVERIGMAGSGAILVHPDTTVSPASRLSPGVLVAMGSRIGANVSVGLHSHVNVAAIIGPDSEIGSYVSLSPGSIIGTGAKLGDGAFVGTRAVIAAGAIVGSGVTIGAGARAMGTIPPGSMVVGK
jgi:sugar O-acyltransferase (sialic acid O-acetyltransferase NeuD family)